VSSAREFAVLAQNLQTRKWNNLVCELLGKVTGEQRPATPESWWQWWYDRNEVYYKGEKPIETRYDRKEPPRPRRRHDCLGAGTTLWTDSGPLAVEKVRVGDLVLAQHPRTGQLAYQPVLRTTIRPPEKLLDIKLENETIAASGGHPFWVAGQGWVKARDLKPGSLLHGVSGPVRVEQVTERQTPQPSYNLIVADFHSCFAGSSNVFSHDNTVCRPTAEAVPGLVEQ